MNNENLQKSIEDFINAHNSEIAEFLSSLIQFKTVSGELEESAHQFSKNEIKRVIAFLQTFADKNGFHFKNYDDLVATLQIGDKEEHIGVLLHLDVVPATDEEWEFPPFEGKIDEDGTVWGRGAVDNKGPVASSLFGLLALKHYINSENIQLNKSIRFIFGTNEETGDWHDIKYYLEQEKPPEFSIVPDAAFPIIAAEKGMFNVKFSTDFLHFPPLFLTGEDTTPFVEIVSGERPNIVPDYAKVLLHIPGDECNEFYSVLGHSIKKFINENPSASITLEPVITLLNNENIIQLNFYGKSAHGSLPYLGHNALLDALQFVLFINIFLENSHYHNFIKFLWDKCNTLYGEGFGIKKHHDFMGDLTNNLGMMRMNYSSAEAVVNIRHVFDFTIDNVVEKIKERVDEINKDVSININCELLPNGVEPLYVDAEKYAAYINPLKVAFEAITQKPAKLEVTGGTTYAKSIPLGVSYGPTYLEAGEKELAHQTDENVSTDVLVRNAKIYGLAMGLLVLE